MNGFFKTILHTVQQAFYPKRCAYCQTVIPEKKQRCGTCAAKLRPIAESCPYCGYALAHCTCGKVKSHFAAMTAAFYYSGLPKQAVQNLKFYGHGDAAPEMAWQLAKKVKKDFAGISFDYIMAVPMYQKCQRQRGYNQAELLARALAGQLALPYCGDVLYKAFDTPPQHSLPGHLRSGNVIGAFDIKTPDRVCDKQILLIDDVYTTGATIDECARVIKIFGAQSVHCAVFTVTRKGKGEKKK